MYFIYGLREVGSAEFRYIGQTQNPSSRLATHKSPDAKGRQQEKYTWVSQSEIELVVLHECEDQYDAAELEYDTIRKYRKKNHRLFNNIRLVLEVHPPSKHAIKSVCNRVFRESKATYTV